MFTKPTKANAKASHFALIYPNCALQASYVYDDLNQLIRENNATANKTWVYTYDERGNILSKDTYAYTTGTLGAVEDSQPYWYYDQWSTEAWGDVLRAYDYSPYFSYDSIGNPLVYIRDGSLFNFTWQNGRQLASGTKGSTSFAYTYNADGLRTKKVVDGVTTEYYWAGSQLAMMIVNPDLSTQKVLKFYYDAEGIPMCLDYNGTVYYYITNLQGDVVALADQYGEVIRYEYDAWGKPISTYYAATPYHDAMYYNPLRYRGYIYDNETGFYYLQSRYYDPVVGRFINSDAYASTGQGVLGHNMFAYCGNNPVNREDSTGRFWITALLVTAVVAVCAVTLSGCSAQSTSDVGAASAYSPSNSTDYNCYAYALGETQWKYVGGSPDAIKDFDVDSVAEMVMADAQKDGRVMRMIDSYDSPIESNEYRIALRTGAADYHFMVQHDDGSWSHKPGICSTRLIDGANPSVVSWDAPLVNSFLCNFGVVKEIGYIPNYYDSNTIYFAVSK